MSFKLLDPRVCWAQGHPTPSRPRPKVFRVIHPSIESQQLAAHFQTSNMRELKTI